MRKLLLVIFLFLSFSQGVAAYEPENENIAVKKTFTVLKKRFVSSIDIVGEITARKQIYIASNFHSKLEMLADDGLKVKKNQVIAKLSTKEESQRLSEQEMNLIVARNDLELLEKNSSAELIKLDSNVLLAQKNVELKSLELAKVLSGATKEELKKLELNIDFAKNAFELSKRNLSQKKKLFEKGIAKKKEILELELAVAKAEKDYRVSNAEYLLTKAGATDTTKEIAKLDLIIAKNKLEIEKRNKAFKLVTSVLEKKKIQAKVDKIQAKVNELTQWVESATIKAPVDGTVIISKIFTSNGLNKVKVGDEVYKGRPFMSVANLDDSVIKSEIEEQYIGRITPGTPCDISIATLKDKIFKGKVVKVGVFASEKKGSEFQEGESKVFEIDIDLTDKNSYDFKPGMSVDIKIIIKSIKDVPVIPNVAIFKEGSQNFVIMESGEKRYIDILDTNSEESAIKKGLNTTEKVIYEENQEED